MGASADSVASVLVAEDDPTSQRMMDAMLRKAGFGPVLVQDGTEAWDRMQRPDAPRLLLVDWHMPGLTGVELCRLVRAQTWRVRPYIILVTSSDDVVQGLEAGASDFVKKPVDPQELRARLQVGVDYVDLQEQLAQRVDELANALEQVRTLEGIIPICAYCRNIQSDDQAWHRMEKYVSDHTDARFSHGICPHCVAEHFPDHAGDDERAPECWSGGLPRRDECERGVT